LRRRSNIRRRYRENRRRRLEALRIRHVTRCPVGSSRRLAARHLTHRSLVRAVRTTGRSGSAGHCPGRTDLQRHQTSDENYGDEPHLPLPYARGIEQANRRSARREVIRHERRNGRANPAEHEPEPAAALRHRRAANLTSGGASVKMVGLFASLEADCWEPSARNLESPPE